MEKLRYDPERDYGFENQLLFNRDALCYRILSHAMDHGAISLVEDILAVWVPIFKGCKKHKYASHLKNFLICLKNYPPPLARAIRLNWLCNPTGAKDGFRAIDWLVELNNLYIKVRVRSILGSLGSLVCVYATHIGPFHPQRSCIPAVAQIATLRISSSNHQLLTFTGNAMKILKITSSCQSEQFITPILQKMR